MNTSQFMDKQILGLTASASLPPPPNASGAGGRSGEVFDLMNPQEEKEDELRRSNVNGIGVERKREEIVPSYDFQPLRSSSSVNPSSSWPPPSSSSIDSKVASTLLKNAGILEPQVLTKVSHEEERGNCNNLTVAEVDRTVKKYADTLLHALEGLNVKLSQLDNRTRHLEGSVSELNIALGNYNGSTEGRLRQFENILVQVQDGVQALRDRQALMEAQVQLAKLQAPKADSQPTEKTSMPHPVAQQPQPDPLEQMRTAHQPPPDPREQMPVTQQVIQLPQAPPPSQQLLALPAPNAPPPPAPLQAQPSGQFPSHLPPSQPQSFPSIPRDKYFSSLPHPTEAAHQQYQAPVQQAQPPAAPSQQYQPPPQFSQYSQPPPSAAAPSPQVHPSQVLPPAPQQPDETVPYAPPMQNFQPVRPPAPYMPPSSGPPAPFYAGNPPMYEPPPNRPSHGAQSYTGAYGPPGGSSYTDTYNYSGSPSHRGSSGLKPSPFAPSGPPLSGGGNYGGRLPMAQLLPQAVPVGSGPSSSSGSRVPVDDVVERVASMGFPRDMVRATVQKLTENGQNVDLNVVLDRLTNGEGKGWYGR